MIDRILGRIQVFRCLDIVFENSYSGFRDKLILEKNSSANLKYPLHRTAIRTLLISGGMNYKEMYNETTGTETSDKNIINYSSSLLFQNIDRIFLGGYMQALTNADDEKSRARIVPRLTEITKPVIAARPVTRVAWKS